MSEREDESKKKVTVWENCKHKNVTKSVWKHEVGSPKSVTENVFNFGNSSINERKRGQIRKIYVEN